MAKTSIGPIVKMRWPFASYALAGPPIPGLTDHYLMIFYHGDGFAIANDIVVLNMDTLTCTVTVGPTGRPIATPQFHPVSGLVYFGFQNTTSIASAICSYDFANHSYRKLADFPTYLDGVTTKYDVPLIVMISEETPARMFFGGSDGCGGTLCAWTEAGGGSLENFGPLDDPGSGQNRYISSMQIDADYAYCALYDTGAAKKYLVITTLATGAETLYWKEDGLKSVQIRRKIASPHPVHAYVTLADGVTTKWYLLSGTGAPTEVSDPTAWSIGNFYSPGPDMTGYVRDMTFAYTGMYAPEDIEDKHIRLGVTIAPAPAAYALAELTSLDTWAAGYCGLDADNNLLCSLTQASAAAGSVYRYNRDADNIDVFCTPKLEVWSMYSDPHREKTFFGGYPAGAFAIYDTTAAQSATNPVIPPHNFTSKHYTDPCRIYRIDRMVDNSLWLIREYIRTITEKGEILRYDPDTDTDTNVLSPLFEDYQMNCSCPNLAKSMMVVSASDAAGLSTLFVMQVLRQNTEGHPITKMISLPVVGLPTEKPWGVVCVETGVVADANRFVVINKSTTPYRAICINVATGQTIWDVTQSGAPLWPDRTTPQFAYGYVWFFSGLNMVKVDVATGTETNVTIGGVPILTTSANYNEIIWDKVNKIMYFNHGSDKSVYRVEGIDGI